MRRNLVVAVLSLMLFALLAPAMCAASDGPQLVWTVGPGHETSWDCPRDDRGRQYASEGDHVFIDWYNFSSAENGWHYMYERIVMPNSAKVTAIDQWGSYIAQKQGICDAEGVLVSSLGETPTPNSPVISSQLIVQRKVMAASMTRSAATLVDNETAVLTVNLTCTNISDQVLTGVWIEGKNRPGPYAHDWIDLAVWANRSYAIPPALWIGNEWGTTTYIAGSAEILLPGQAEWIKPSGDVYSGGIKIGKLRDGESFQLRFQVTVYYGGGLG